MNNLYEINTTKLDAWLITNPQPKWLERGVLDKIEQIRSLSHPKDIGGWNPLAKRWFYTVGKFQIVQISMRYIILFFFYLWHNFRNSLM